MDAPIVQEFKLDYANKAIMAPMVRIVCDNIYML